MRTGGRGKGGRTNRDRTGTGTRTIGTVKTIIALRERREGVAMWSASGAMTVLRAAENKEAIVMCESGLK